MEEQKEIAAALLRECGKKGQYFTRLEFDAVLYAALTLAKYLYGKEIYPTGEVIDANGVLSLPLWTGSLMEVNGCLMPVGSEGTDVGLTRMQIEMLFVACMACSPKEALLWIQERDGILPPTLMSLKRINDDPDNRIGSHVKFQLNYSGYGTTTYSMKAKVHLRDMRQIGEAYARTILALCLEKQLEKNQRFALDEFFLGFRTVLKKSGWSSLLEEREETGVTKVRITALKWPPCAGDNTDEES